MPAYLLTLLAFFFVALQQTETSLFDCVCGLFILMVVGCVRGPGGSVHLPAAQIHLPLHIGVISKCRLQADVDP